MVRRLCRRLNIAPTRLVNQALREMLEREGLWPPPELGTTLSSKEQS